MYSFCLLLLFFLGSFQLVTQMNMTAHMDFPAHLTDDCFNYSSANKITFISNIPVFRESIALDLSVQERHDVSFPTFRKYHDVFIFEVLWPNILTLLDTEEESKTILQNDEIYLPKNSGFHSKRTQSLIMSLLELPDK